MSTQVAPNLKTRYQKDGYCLAPNIIPQDLVQRAIEGQDALRKGHYDTGIAPVTSPWNPGDDPNILCKIEMPHIANQAIYDLVTHPDLGHLIASLTDADWVQVFWVQMLYKPPAGPNARTRVGWHQDLQYWQTWTPDSQLLTAWVALSDVNDESGPVRFVRGSHKWGLLKAGDFHGQQLDNQKEAIQPPPGSRWEEAPGILSPGSASVHHCLTYHGSGPNVSDSPRRSFAIHLRTNHSKLTDNYWKVSEEEGINLVQYLDNDWYNPIIYRRN
jgi:hypothetical protein